VSDPPRFVPGDVLAGRYRIVSLLGRGGMGEVYRAEDLRLEQPIALKFLPLELVGDEDHRRRLFEEVRVARRVSHPNVCRVHDVGEEAGQTYLTMEYVDGEDLASLLRRIGRLPPDKAIEIAHQLCAGLAAAHEQGVLHRDLKPANVMVDGEGRVRIADFGLAAVATRLGGDQARVGTPRYMAPEQLAGREVSAQSDLFSLGLVLFELFTGRPAFEARTLDELVRAHESGSPSPAEHLPDIDPAVEAVIARCLAHDPRERPRSAREVSAGLPGGDPLAAALAAGETPSPELIAAAGGRGVLPRWAAWGAFAGVLACVAFLAWADRRVMLFPRVAPELAPAVLEHRAREVARALGFSEEPADSAWGFAQRVDPALFDEGSDEPWHRLVNPWSEGLRFWWRGSPEALVPEARSGRVAWSDPPIAVAGMLQMILAHDGRLLGLRALPRAGDGTDGAFDWNLAFQAAGLDRSAFEERRAEFLPQEFATDRRAWSGSDPAAPGAEITVEAAALGTRLVHWNARASWGGQAPPEPARSRLVRVLHQVSGTAIDVLALVGGLWWGIANLARRKGDRRTATRVAFFLFGLGALEWLLGAHHGRDVVREVGRAIAASERWLYLAAFGWILYVALEPTVRSLGPHKLVAWTRLVAGRTSDPAVGRDVLLGILGGLAVQVVTRAHWLVVAGLGDPAARPQLERAQVYEGVLALLAALVGLVGMSGLWALLILFVYLLFLRVLRRRALALGAFFLLGMARMPHAVVGASAWIDGGMRSLMMAIILALVLRAGILSLAALFFVLEGLESASVQVDGGWTASPGQLVVTILIAASAYGAFVAARGAPLTSSTAASGRGARSGSGRAA